MQVMRTLTLPKRARVRNYGLAYTGRFCALSDSLALWESLGERYGEGRFSSSAGERKLMTHFVESGRGRWSHL